MNNLPERLIVSPFSLPVTSVINRLVLVPQRMDGTAELAAWFSSLVRQFGGGGNTYIYVAINGQKEAEDHESGVRLISLCADRLPSFGNVASVHVLNDWGMAGAAATEYPSSVVYHLETGTPVEERQAMAA